MMVVGSAFHQMPDDVGMRVANQSAASRREYYLLANEALGEGPGVAAT